MTPALWGAVGALSWGSADFIARFSGRALGPRDALLGMLVAGALALSLGVAASGPLPVWTAGGLALVAVSGVFAMLATLLLYAALARGPVTIVAPIVGSYPALVLLVWLALGVRPSPLEWAGMIATMLGVVVVARAARGFAEPGVFTIAHLRRSVSIAMLASASFAIAVAAGQRAVPLFGELHSLWLGRLVSLAALLALFAMGRRTPVLAPRWWPVLALQGLLDTGGYLALFTGSHGPGGALAAVTASAFGVVTVLLARVFLREPVGAGQWLGIASVFGGVAALSGSR